MTEWLNWTELTDGVYCEVFQMWLFKCWGSFLLFLVCWVFLFFNQWKGTEFCQMLFLHQLRWSCVFFHSFCLCGYLDWFLYVKLHCTLRTNSTWSWSMILPILVASFCWGILYQCVPSSSISGKRLRIDISSLNVWYNSTVKSSFWYMPSSSSFTQWF